MNMSRVKMYGFITGAVVLMACLGIDLMPSKVNTSHTVFGDHPEQTMKRKEMEKSAVTLEDVAKFVEEYVRKNSKDGLFKYYDKYTKKELELIFDRIHREKLSKIKKNEYFACVDFKGKDGKAYDLDFFVEGKSRNYFAIDKKDISVHKVNGKENYTWHFNKKKGLWEKQAIIIKKEYPEPTKETHPGYP